MESTDGTIEELEGYVSFLEDVPGEWLEQGGSRLAQITERLQRLRESLK